MKKLICILLTIVLVSCNKTDIKYGEIKVTNGVDKKISIPYSFVGYKEFNKIYSKSDFNYIAEKTTSDAKSFCKYELTFEPLKLELFINHDTTTCRLDFSAKSGFGVPQKMHVWTKFAGKYLKQIQKLPPSEVFDF
jgi:hypothetical protein